MLYFRRFKLWLLFSWDTMYLYLLPGTHLQVRPVDGFSHLMAQTTRTRARMCLLGVSLILLPIRRSHPQNLNFGDVNWHLHVKWVKILFVIISKQQIR